MMFKSLLISIFFSSGPHLSFAEERPKAVYVERNATFHEAITIVIPIKNSGGKEIWRSKDGLTKCLIDPWGEKHRLPTQVSMDCWHGDKRTQLSFDCNNIIGKEKRIAYFWGGVSDYNQNFKIWCK